MGVESHVAFWVTCDGGEPFGERCQNSTKDDPAKNMTEARKKARAKGWTKKRSVLGDEQWFCPDENRR